MTVSLLVLAGVVAAASAGYLGGHASYFPATSVVYTSQHVQHAHALSAGTAIHIGPENTDDTRKEPTDPRATAAFDIHKAFLKRIEVQPPYSYSYGFEYQDDTRKMTRNQYESRYGDVGVGTATEIDPEGRRTTVFYTVDDASGFNAVVHNDSRRHYAYMGYARLAAPLSFASHPAPEVYAPLATLYADPNATISKSGPLGITAYRAHLAFRFHTGVEPPYKYSWGYEIHEAHSGRTKSQYESYYGDSGEGNFALVEPGGRLRTIDYNVDETGFAVATPAAPPKNTAPLVKN